MAFVRFDLARGHEPRPLPEAANRSGLDHREPDDAGCKIVPNEILRLPIEGAPESLALEALPNCEETNKRGAVQRISIDDIQQADRTPILMGDERMLVLEAGAGRTRGGEFDRGTRPSAHAINVDGIAPEIVEDGFGIHEVPRARSAA